MLALTLAIVCAPRTFAAGADALPDALWWGARAVTPLAADPLQLAAEPATVSLQSTWWPLYEDASGGRVAGESHRMRVASARAPARAAFELTQDGRLLTAGSGAFRMDAREAPARRVTLAGAWDATRVAGAAALTLGEGSAAGWSLGGMWRPAPRWSAEWHAARLSGRGTLGVRWNDELVMAGANWTDRALSWTLHGASAGADPVRVTLGLVSRDRTPDRGAERDRAESRLAWREASGALEWGVGAARVGLSAWQGGGRQSTTVTRAGTPYARAAGPVRNCGTELAAGPRGSDLRVRAWAGRWSGDADGSLAYWPFQSLAGALGTRRVAESEADLRHAGVAFERDSARGVGWGLALWGVAPSARARSWQATLFGIGRDDYSESAMTLDRALLLGVRVAPSLRLGATRARLALVQWVPVRMWRAGGGAGDDNGTPGGGTSGGATTHGGGNVTSGGTVVEFTLER